MWFFILVLYLIYRNRAGADEAKSLVGKIFGGYLGIFIFLIILLDNPGLIVLPIIGFMLWIMFRAYKRQEDDTRKEEYGWTTYGQPGNEYHEKARIRKEKSSQTAGKVFSRILPKSVAKRKRIVEKFDKEYKLYLTPEQVESIVNSTYMSEHWKKEVEAMTDDYEIPAQWMMGDTKWLRAYLYAFTRQDVTYDFKQQEQIVLTAFEQVMRYSDSLGPMSLAERIDRINSRFFTQFNDVTFMIAYRYLETKGIHHPLDVVVTENLDDPVESLARKYQHLDPNMGYVMEEK